MPRSHQTFRLVFVIFLNSKLITCFIDGFTLIMKSQSLAYLLNRSEHILDLEGEVHSLWDLWSSGLQEYKGKDFFFKVGQASITFQLVQENWGGYPCLNLPPLKVYGGNFNVPP
jgi:hypothetical protein